MLTCLRLQILFASLGLVHPGAAHAQTCPQQSSPQFTTGGDVFGRIAAQWNAYFAGKVDANAGTLCNPTIVGTITLTLSEIVSALGYTPLRGPITSPKVGDVAVWSSDTTLRDAGNLGVSPAYFGASTAAADNTAALQAAFQSGVQINMDGIYQAAGPINVTGCPSIRGAGPLTGTLFTGTSGGLNITCTAPTRQYAAGRVVLKDFSIDTSAAGGGTALILTLTGAPLNNLGMEGIHISGDTPDTHYWNDLVHIRDGQQTFIKDNWLSGGPSSAPLTTNGFTFTNSGVLSSLHELLSNTVYKVSGTAIRATMTGHPAIEGMVLRDNALIINTMAINIDASGASYVPPGWIIAGNQTNSAGACITLTNLSQVIIRDNVLYNGASGNCIAVLGNSGRINLVGNDIYALSPNPDIGINLAGTATIGEIDGNWISAYTTGIQLAAGTSAFSISNNSYVSVTTKINDLSSGANFIGFDGGVFPAKTIFDPALPTTPGGLQPACYDPATRRLYAGKGGAC